MYLLVSDVCIISVVLIHSVESGSQLKEIRSFTQYFYHMAPTASLTIAVGLGIYFVSVAYRVS